MHMAIISKGNYINGSWKQSKGEAFNSYSPINDEVLWNGNLSTREDVDYAVKSARSAFELWSELSVEERIDYLRKYISVVEENKDILAECISNEVGKPYWESLTEVNSIIGKLEPCIEAYNLRNQTIIREQNDGSKSITRFKPHGVVGIIGPYNFPAIAWDVLTRARAIENEIYFCACNQTGKNLCAGTRVVSYDGTIIKSLGEEEGILTVDLDLEKESIYRSEMPILEQI